jgi:hypothetical protein
MSDTDKNALGISTEMSTGEGLAEQQPTPETGQVEEKQKEAAAEVEELRLKYEELLNKSKKDLDGLKSSLQRRESELTKEFQDKERKYREDIEKLRRSTMDEKDRDAYEKELGLNRIKELEDARVKAEQDKAQLEQFYYYLDYFTNKLGVSRNDLVLEEGTEKLFASGMAAIEKKLTSPAVAPVKPNGKPKTPPEVAQPGTGAVGTGLSLKELAKKKVGGDSAYDIDQLFNLIQSGQLPLDLLNEVLSKQSK